MITLQIDIIALDINNIYKYTNISDYSCLLI